MGYKAQKIYVGDNLVWPEGGKITQLKRSVEFYASTNSGYSCNLVTTTQPGGTERTRNTISSYYGTKRVELLYSGGGGTSGNVLTQNQWTKSEVLLNLETGAFTLNQYSGDSVVYTQTGTLTGLIGEGVYIGIKSADSYYPTGYFRNFVCYANGRKIIDDPLNNLTTISNDRTTLNNPSLSVSSGYLTISRNGTNGAGIYRYVGNTNNVLFDFGDWTNSEWTVNSGAQSNISKQTDRISFYNSSNYISSYLSQYEIDGTKDFLLEMRAYLPSTSVGYHHLTLNIGENNDTKIGFRTKRESRGTLFCTVNGSDYAGVSNPGTQDFFIKKEGNTLSMGRGGVVKYTTTHTFASKYYLYASVYRDTITIYTAKLTYL